MPGDMIPTQPYQHDLNPYQGYTNNLHAIVKTAPLAAGETLTIGRTAYLDANAQFRLGLIDNSVAHFMRQGNTSFDVNGDRGNTISQNPSGLPCTAPYELETTEYDPAFTYTPNTLLTAWDSQLSGFVLANKGMIRSAEPYCFDFTLCGVCSDGTIVNNGVGYQVVRFYTHFAPICITGSSARP